MFVYGARAVGRCAATNRTMTAASAPGAAHARVVGAWESRRAPPAGLFAPAADLIQAAECSENAPVRSRLAAGISGSDRLLRFTGLLPFLLIVPQKSGPELASG